MDDGSLLHLAKALDDSPDVCYILDDDFRFVHCNRAWDHFAAANGGRKLEGEQMIGADLFASIPPVLAGAYRHAFESVRVSGRVWVKAYECSSPTVFRKFQMRIHPLQHPQQWFLVTNALLVEQPHERQLAAAGPAYLNRGIITMCSHCRCSRRTGTDQWDFVPQYLELQGADALHVSHGLCPICLAYFYPELKL